MRKTWFFGLLLILAAAAAVVFLKQRPLAVATVNAEENVQLRLYGLGMVEARVLSRVGFEVGAALVSLSADAGDVVTKGQELAALHTAEQDARVARARAAVTVNTATLTKAEVAVTRARAVLAEREATNNRQQELARKNLASDQRAEEAKRDEDVARADLSMAEADLTVIRAQGEDASAALQVEESLLLHHRLIAPYDAVVVTRHVELGAVVKAGDPIFTLIDPDTIWVQAFIDEERAGQLGLGQPGTIRLRSQPAAEFHGTIARIGLESDRVNQERQVWLACDDCPETMYLGEQAEVRILTGTRETALMVPEVAISGFDGHHGTVWVVRDGRLERADLSFGARDDRGRVEVTGGLPDDVKIVARPPKGAAVGRRARVENAS